jgi:hypothetical protein
MARVFMSYSSKDRDFVARLATDIRSAGHEVWFDAWNITGREPYWDEIQEGIEGCVYFVFAISPEAIDRQGGAAKELYHAAGIKPMPTIIPVLVRETPFNKLPIIITPGMYQIHDFVNHPYESMVTRVLAALNPESAPQSAPEAPRAQSGGLTGEPTPALPKPNRAFLYLGLGGVLVVLAVIGILVVPGMLTGAHPAPTPTTAAPTIAPTAVSITETTRGAAPTSAAANASDGPLLNGNFSAGFDQTPSKVRDGAVIAVARNWTRWWVPGSGTNAPFGGEPIFANASYNDSTGPQQIFDVQEAFTAGIYQSVKLPTLGKWTATASVFAYSTTVENSVTSVKPGPMRIRVGIDPNGGTNSQAASIVWSSDTANNVTTYDQPIDYQVTADLKQANVTVFIECVVPTPVEAASCNISKVSLSAAP